MKELIEYRIKLLARLGEAAQEFRLACEAILDPYEKMEGNWTLHQIASHTRDVDKFIYGARIRRTLIEDNPEFKSFDADEWMKTNYNKDESLAKILSEFKTNVDEICETLSKQPREVWSRESRHETIGDGLPLQLWVERSLAHIEEHLLTLKKAKNK
jgi:hypothetical protein